MLLSRQTRIEERRHENGLEVNGCSTGGMFCFRRLLKRTRLPRAAISPLKKALFSGGAEEQVVPAQVDMACGLSGEQVPHTPQTEPDAANSHINRARGSLPLRPKAFRGPHVEKRAHHHPEIPGRDVHQVAFGHVHQFSEPTPPGSARLAYMREAAFGVLTAKTTQRLAALPANPATIVVYGPLFFL